MWIIGIGLARADPLSELMDRISQCAGIADSGERLKCFDRVSPAAKDALTPKPADFGKPVVRVPEVPQIVAVVRELSRTVRGQALFVLDNGQVWRQIDGDGSTVRDPDPSKPLKVTIEHGLLDSYNLLIEGQNGLIKVRRVQ